MAPKARPTEERFWEKVDTSGDCWEWTASKRDTGYGQFYISRAGKQVVVNAHKFSFELAYGLVPKGKKVDHKCRNRGCVNPSHLRLTTNKQNSENRNISTSSVSGIRGVGRKRNHRKWYANVTHNGRHHHVGYFDTKEQAGQAAMAKRNELFTHNDADRQKQP